MRGRQRVRRREREFMSDTSEGLCELKSTIVCCRLQLRDDKDGLLLDLCVCVCVALNPSTADQTDMKS